MGTVVALEHLRKRYGEVLAVDDVSFEVGEGEIFGLIGPNGAGKTTTVECLQGLRRPDGGTMRVLGLDPATQADELRRLVGSQLQESALPDRIKVWEALDLFAAFALGTLAFLAVGFVLGALIPTARAAQGLGLILFFANMFLSGADGPRELMPEWMKTTGDALPLTHVVTALQDPWIGFGWNGVKLGILAGIFTASAALAMRLFR